MNVALEIKNVTKIYEKRTVVDRVSLVVECGETFGLLGPNGSGKTTTIRMALDIVRPESGDVSLLGGMPTREALTRVGYLPEERGLYQKSKVIDVLTYLGRLKRMEAATAKAHAQEMLQRVGLYEHRNKKVQALSRGMTQLVQFAGALLHKPDLIILDEPFAGLDPLNVQLMKEILHEQKHRGAAVVFSTHQMADVEELCERVLLINDGQTLLYGHLAELKRDRGSHSVRITADRQPQSIPGVIDTKVGNGSFEYLLVEETEPDEILRLFLDVDIPVERYEVALPSLNQIFIEEVSRARNAK
ncbi:MAG: ATP-binding cassette domain-containing protein [Candidatus Bipolaricaulota bacterium]|nr:ATP-binding cassette domain-containing protein [Candidatus Bipolaricaulota bacterium]